MFQHFNFWFIIVPAGILMSFAVGYLRIFDDRKHGRRMRWFSETAQGVVDALIAASTGFCIFAESHAGILTVISGGKTAEQIARDGTYVALAVILFVVGVVVYAIALIAMSSAGEQLKLRKLNRARHQARAAAAAAVADAETPAETAPQDDRPTLTIIDERRPYVLGSIVFDLSPRSTGPLFDHDQAVG